MNIAVFADVHGRILLAFKLCARWEQETGQKIDLILQAGDLGAFPDERRLDKATRRYAQSDPTELGFLIDFVEYDPKIADILAQTACSMVFVRGNHEDHLWLDRLEAQTNLPIFPVDAYQRVYCLKSGVPYIFETGCEMITILGIGRVGALENEYDNQQPKYIQSYERERVYTLEDTLIDVLLTHDAPKNFIFPYGMEEISLILDEYRPFYHFFGHYGGPCRMGIDSNGVTRFCKLADLHWDRHDDGKRIEENSMGMLHWTGRDEHWFEVVNEPWLSEYSGHTWKYM